MSNIAWSIADRIEAYKILHEFGIKGLEIAPKLLFPNSVENKVDLLGRETLASMRELHNFELKIVSLQSLLYGLTNAKLFTGKVALAVFDKAMRAAISLAGELGVGNVVFGSPDSRLFPEAMTEAEAYDIGREVFFGLGNFARGNGTTISVEAIPIGYGSDFLTDTYEVINFVSDLDHSAVKLNLDLGVCHFLNEHRNIESLIKNNVSLIGHVHISEPGLAPAPVDVLATAAVLRVLKKSGYDNWISIEMKEQHSNSINTLRMSVNTLVDAANLVDPKG